MSKKSSSKKKESKRPVDVYFEQYAESHQHPTNKLIHWVCVPLITFSISSLIWFIPFPHLSFLGQYNGFVNWFTLVMAIVVYYYLRLAPTLSYAMLFSFGVFSFLIVQLEYWEQAGGPAPWIVALIIFVVAWIGQFVGHKIEGKKPSFLTDVKFLLIGPIWLWHFIFKKLNIPY
ncbi:DUF962 domain-containing protein [Olivibacter sp. SDN3]|uniref:Mpo1 family 2-hydroxy fatty acid dioxygenase n=1 Tax=Olivibacter sp. SDN3 TaxID=2764720 RepID=UPI00165149F1|nr:Mpo1-like protein [Olivibacter sp. SDN3]QNL49473.1 DUF962 domain-containing protein [Olivibacter sp. SDN3]